MTEQRPASPLVGPAAVAQRLARFAAVLRAVGVPVGSGEVLDSLAALALLGPLDRAGARLALSATLAKDQRSRELCGRAFDLFFTPPAAAAGGPAAPPPDAGGEADQPAAWDQAFTLSDEQARAFGRLSAAQQERLREFVGRVTGEGEADCTLRPLVEHVIAEHLARWAGPDRAAAPVVRSTGDGDLDRMGQAVLAGAGGAADPLLTMDVADIPPDQIDQARRLIQRLAQRLATRLTRRLRRAAGGRRVDFRRTIRANQRYGGTPLVLRYRAPRRLRPKILLVCDVSGSMTAYTSFVLHFAVGLGRYAREIRAFVFAEDLEEVTGRLRRLGASFGDAADLAAGSPIWGKGTNLATALDRLTAEHSGALTPTTTLLIISDTKTLAAAAAARTLGLIRRRVRDVIWLNPEPAGRWDRLPALADFARHARMFPCSTLGELRGVLDRAFSRGPGLAPSGAPGPTG